MKTFQIYRHPTIGTQAVKVGFCWPAFFFTGIWVLLSRLWGWAILWWVITILWIQTERYGRSYQEFDQDIPGFGISSLLEFVQIIYAISAGLLGNEWRIKNLSRRGFELVCTIQAETKDAAIAQESKLNSGKDVPIDE